jgi:DNA repair protein SbcC/Rad50
MKILEEVGNEIEALNVRLVKLSGDASLVVAGAKVSDANSLAKVAEVISTRLQSISSALEMYAWANSFADVDKLQDMRVLLRIAENALFRANSLISSYERELDDGSRLQVLQVQKKLAEENLHKLTIERDKVNDALKALTVIVEKDSLPQATQNAIEATHSVADEIFSRIHVPNEYKIAANSNYPLSGKSDNENRSLSQISTGQRSAYALSIFLAMNAQMTSGPKVILLDDPISHVDDLNALSFLDYLRNLVLKESRQIFFATADERVAGLFAHKFAFLGEEFRTIDLVR